ncbi:4750_t:CDS:2, partial [Cetraspora pellucida]
NSAWEAYTINEFKNLKVTDSLRFKESVIIEAINSKFKKCRKPKDFGLLAFDVKVNRRDNSINIIITYKQKLILVQCKNTEMPIPVQILKEKGKFATLKAKQWAYTSKRNIKICNENQFVGIIKEFYKSDNDDYVEL